MKINLTLLALALLGALSSCNASLAAADSDNALRSCSRTLPTTLTMNPGEFYYSWRTASASYDPDFKLAPTVVLFGKVSGEYDGKALNSKDGEVFLHFWPDEARTNAAWSGPDKNGFYFDYPFSHMESLMKIVEGPNPFEVIYKEQDGRCSGLIQEIKRTIPFKSTSQ